MNILIQKFKTELLNNGFLGEFHDDYATRLLNSTDNSIYELMPDAVIQPKDFIDLHKIIILANQEEFLQIKFTARGGGTGTNGQSLTNGIIIDFSRFMNKILEFKPEEQTILVEPGIILTELNRFLKPYGLFFAPHVSTADRATIGGMIATDAAGKGSLIYGKTSDHIISTKLIMANGEIIDSVKPNNLEFEDSYKTNTVKNKLHQKIVDLLIPVQDEISKRFPPLKRHLSGYNIRQCYLNHEFNLNYLIAGSEGTLGIVAQAKLNLLKIPNYRVLFVIHYNSFNLALKDAQFLITHKPLAIEVIDEKVQKSAQSLPNWPTLAKILNCENQTYISNFLEFVADTPDELEQKISALSNDLSRNKAKFVIIKDSLQINQLWSVRSLAVGLAGKIPGQAKPIAFIEDAIVPPEHLANFVMDLQEYLEQQNLNYAMYGHVDVGCIHVRPALDMQLESNRNKIRPITEEVIKLLDKYQGILWGEHGKGFRGEFVPHVFGPILYPILCQIKHLFDPLNRFNPGKLAHPKKMPLDKIELVQMRGRLDQVINPKSQEYFNQAILCNGNAACFNQEPNNVMCPSYKVTQDRIHSPKGRAMLVKEWLRNNEKNNVQDTEIANITFDAMNGCLGCKGCAGKCPTQVSIPELRSKFLDKYHSQYKRRSLRDFMLGYIEHLILIMAKFPKLANLIQNDNLIIKFGLSDVPKLPNTKSLISLIKHMKIPLYKDSKQIKNFSANPVVIFTDVFTGFFDNKLLIATIELCELLGYTPYVIYPRASGKSLVVGGFLAKFKLNTEKLSRLLNPLFDAKVPILGLENTITLMFRDEVNKFATPLNGKILTLAEFFNSNIQNFTKGKNTIDKKYRLLPHCTEQAILPSEANHWIQIFKALDIDLEVANVGCCGMAGVYGYQSEHKDYSKELFQMHWQKELSSNAEILATGFSCRCQTQKISQKTIVHPVELLAKIVNNINTNQI